VLTRTGWLASTGAVALVIAGRVFGILELFLLGTAAGLLVVLCAAMVGLTRLRLEVSRDLHPARVHAGTPSRVSLVVRNRGPRRTPVLELRDKVSGTRGARLLLGPLAREAQTSADYELPTDRRGIVTVGPLHVVVGDPFGVAEVRVEATGVSELTVYPRVDDIGAVPLTSGTDPHAGADHPNNLSPAGEDFFALREYVVGDDLRRVHWPSTARQDHLMVRQDELPWQGRATVLLDLRKGDLPADAVEAAVSAAASILRACRRRNHQVRLVTSDGLDSGFVDGHAQVEAVMEHLAVVEASERTDLRPGLACLTRSRGGSLTALVPSAIAAADLAQVQALRTIYGRVTVLQFERSSWDPDAPLEPVDPNHPGTRVNRRRPFPLAWEDTIRAATRRTGTSTRATA
jgi:uncharacterized protein (DUF58 family)